MAGVTRFLFAFLMIIDMITSFPKYDQVMRSPELMNIVLSYNNVVSFRYEYSLLLLNKNACNNIMKRHLKELSTINRLFRHEFIPRICSDITSQYAFQYILNDIGSIIYQLEHGKRKLFHSVTWDYKNKGCHYATLMNTVENLFHHGLALTYSDVHFEDIMTMAVTDDNIKFEVNKDKETLLITPLIFSGSHVPTFTITTDHEITKVGFIYNFDNYNDNKNQHKVVKEILKQDIYQYYISLNFFDYYYNENDFKELNLIDKDKLIITMHYNGIKDEEQVINIDKPLRLYNSFKFKSTSRTVSTQLKLGNISIGDNNNEFEVLKIKFAYTHDDYVVLNSANSRIISFPKTFSGEPLRIIRKIKIESKGFPPEFKHELKQNLERLTRSIERIDIVVGDWQLRSINEIDTFGPEWEQLWQ